ncbi:hypothetical protein K227x_30210 [Rubripirellula lacrimiformis]|uniref:Protease PrsW n=1 Tax=Rubripirellula lacrimiformis TaxID=1930273 RepID=A0A517NC77_9BACT|nr:PrsW family glutamic-type intramembrane protease [Rubripirellula lacrimiformis]QDT04628.1 hypothetical protein K227x_30210 [Rubripirellula lacrimiformis]
MNWKTFLRQQTTQPVFLWQMVAVVLSIGVIGGVITSRLPHRYSPDSNSIGDVVAAVRQATLTSGGIDDLRNQNVPYEHLLIAFAFSADVDWIDPEQAASMIGDDGDRSTIAVELIRSVQDEVPTKTLVQMADQRVAYSRLAIGAFYLSQQRYEAAAKNFEAEVDVSDSPIARQFAVDCYNAANDVTAIRRLASDPQYQSLISPSDRLLIAESDQDWGKIFWIIPLLMAERMDNAMAAGLAVFAAAGWFVVLMQMGQADARTGVRWWLCLVGVALGCLSIWPTHLLNIWQEINWDLLEGDDWFQNVKYYVLGVGLREELAKLLLLLPLMPFLASRRNTIEALLVSASVGLGFAMVENMGYFSRSGGTDSMGRFLTANFAHIAMTGLIGLAVARVIWKQQDVSHALLVFLLVMLAHGFYDAAIAVPELSEYSIGGMILFILLAYAFFHEVRMAYVPRSETISLTATFLFAVSAMTATTFMYVSWQVGLIAAATLLATDIVSLALLVYMYLREMPNSLIR